MGVITIGGGLAMKHEMKLLKDGAKQFKEN